MRVVVVSAFGNQPIQFGSELFPGVIAIPVKRPERPWLDMLVALKRRILTQRSAAPASGLSLGSSRSLAAGLRAKLHERYFRTLYFVDEYKKWARNAAKAAIRAGRDYDAALLLASAPPHSALLAGAWASRRLGIPYVADLRDPWSDFLGLTHPDRRRELKMLRLLERWVMRRADAITSTGATVAELLAGRDASIAGKVHVIRNGYDGGIAPALRQTGGRLSILFAGVLYVGRNPFPLLAALEELLSRPDIDPRRIQVTFMGGKLGAFSDESLQAWMQGKRCASVVRILPPQTPEAVAAEVAQATVLLNLAQQQHLSVPAKTYEHLASGREILLICEDDCETAQVVAGIKGVHQVDHSDSQALVRTLLDLYNRHVVAGSLSVPAEADVQGFSRESANDRFYAVLQSLIAPNALRGPTRTDGATEPAPEQVGADTVRAASRGFTRQLIADARFYQHLVVGADRDSRGLVRTMLCSRGLWLLTFHRIAHSCVSRRDVRSVRWWVTRLLKSVGGCFNLLVCRSEFSGDCEIPGSVYLSNKGYLICGARSIGVGSLIHDRCTFGYSVAERKEGRPVIGKNVWIGPDCIIGGAVTIGEGATILPGSFLTYSVPPHAVVKGNPARVVRRDFDNSDLRRSLAIVDHVAVPNP
jgi:serine acetyltransferase